MVALWGAVVGDAGAHGPKPGDLRRGAPTMMDRVSVGATLCGRPDRLVARKGLSIGSSHLCNPFVLSAFPILNGWAGGGPR